jgi:hypothetical protein
MNPNSAIEKGKLLENFIVDRLRISGLDKRAYRQKGSGNGLNKGDIWNALDLCIECKNQKNFSKDWFKQVKKESLGVQIPVVIWHPPQVPLQDSIVMIDWNFFEQLLLKYIEKPSLEKPNREFSYKLNNLKIAVNQLMKEIGDYSTL